MNKFNFIFKKSFWKNVLAVVVVAILCAGIIGGGIAGAFPLFETAMRASLDSFPYPANVSATRIIPSTMPHAAIIGASLL